MVLVVVDGLGDLGILVWLAVVVVLLVIQLWVFGALFHLEWFETFVGTLILLCLTFAAWKIVDFGTARLQSQLMSRETTSVDQHELRGIQERPEDVLEGFDLGLFTVDGLSGSAPHQLPSRRHLAGQRFA